MQRALGLAWPAQTATLTSSFVHMPPTAMLTFTLACMHARARVAGVCARARACRLGLAVDPSADSPLAGQTFTVSE